MDARLKKILRAIDAVLSNTRTAASTHRAEALWHILTALRGPDQVHNVAKGVAAKMVTTAVIREAAFPRAAKHYHAHTDIIGATFSNQPFELAAGKVGGEHFQMHAELAARVLGLLDE